ncbi:MAG: tetratricopeptide repeat protein, partial [Actinomycetota bacterium]
AGDGERARVLFEEALQIARANPGRDPWAEARALVALAMYESEVGGEEVAFGLASEALAIAEAARDRFSIAVARESVGGTLRRMMRLEEADIHLTGAVDGFRELGARWELASALTSRGIVRRLAGRGEEAVRDLQEAYRICVELKERSIITWTASALARALIAAGDPGAARRVLTDTAPLANADGPAPGGWLDEAEVEILLVEGEREQALEKALDVLQRERESGSDKDVAARVWWISEVFGADAAGGVEEVARARELLERLHAVQALQAPSSWHAAPSVDRSV